MKIQIGDTPKQLAQGLMFDGEVWTKDRIQALQKQVEQLRNYVIALTHADETGYVDDIGFVENYSEIRDEVEALVAEHNAKVAVKAVNECIDIAHSKFSVTGITSALQDYANQLRQQNNKE
jgi:hypothetical protein